VALHTALQHFCCSWAMIHHLPALVALGCLHENQSEVLSTSIHRLLSLFIEQKVRFLNRDTVKNENLFFCFFVLS
jgi:hypothetical protein